MAFSKLAFVSLSVKLSIVVWGVVAPIQLAVQATENHFVTVPVYFATSREYDSDKAAYKGTRSPEHKDHGIEYGIVTTTVAMPKETDSKAFSIPNLEEKETTKSSKKQKAHILKLTREEFYKRLKESNQGTSFEETCLFIHGYNNTFEAAAKSAARLEVALKEPVVLFSWPSAAKTKNYTVDECNAEWSERPFQIFVQNLEESIGCQHLMTVSHSMSNRLINWYMQSRFDKNMGKPAHFREIVLTSPDIDRATFKNYFYKVANNSDKVRLYISDKDTPLRLSKFIHGSARTGAGLAAGEKVWSMPGNITPTQTVNFTAVDDSSIGHSIQYDLIGRMHRECTPGKGLTLIPDSQFKGDYVRVSKIKN